MNAGTDWAEARYQAAHERAKGDDGGDLSNMTPEEKFDSIHGSEDHHASKFSSYRLGAKRRHAATKVQAHYRGRMARRSRSAVESAVCPPDSAEGAPLLGAPTGSLVPMVPLEPAP